MSTVQRVQINPNDVRWLTFWSHVNTPKDQPEACWTWTTKILYPRFRVNGKARLCHRLAYLGVHGTNPPELDHLCRNPRCVNPRHLESVSHRENLARGHNLNRSKTTCKRGHPYDSVS